MNIYDISQKAGVSIATVSRVLNGSEKVSEKNTKKGTCCYGRKQLYPQCICKKSRFRTPCTLSASSVQTPLMYTRHRLFISGAGTSQEFLCFHAMLYRI